MANPLHGDGPAATPERTGPAPPVGELDLALRAFELAVLPPLEGGETLGDLRLLPDRVEEPAHVGEPPAAQPVHALGHGGGRVRERPVAVLVDRTQRLVHLDELAGGQPLDDPRLDAVLEHLTV